MEIRENSGRNPLIIISADEVKAWLRQKADDAGFSDRQLCAVQSETDEDDHLIWGVPQIVVMVSNVSDRAASSAVMDDRSAINEQTEVR